MSNDVRVTLRLWQEQADALEGLVEGDEFASRSEAIRTAVDELVDSRNEERTDSKSLCSQGVVDAD